MNWASEFLNRWALLIVVVVVALALWDQSFNGRRDLVNSERLSCQRNQLDRHALAEAWYSAYLAREAQATAAVTPPALRPQYRASAAVYLATARTLNEHASPSLSVQWPPGSDYLPLGAGSLRCDQAFPAATPFAFGG